MLVEIRKYFSSGSCADPQLRSGRRIPGRITANRLRCFIDPSCEHKSPTRETLGILNPGARKGNVVLCASVPSDNPAKRPCRSDISPVYQYPATNSSRKGTVM